MNQFLDSHGQAIAEAITADARRRDEATARWWDAERQPQVLETLARALAAQQAPQSAPVKEPGIMVFDGTKFERRPLGDDFLSFPIPYQGKAEAIRARKAERIFSEIVREETGGPAGQKFTKQKKERLELLAQSHVLAQRLEAAGVPAYRKDGTSLWVYWICSGQSEELARFRRICFLPSVAAQVRAAKLAALEFFLQKNPFCRFWTFTSGPRVGLDSVRSRIEWLHGRLNALNQFLRRRFQVELVFRSTELGTVEFDDDGNGRAEKAAGRIETDQDGAPLFHPHAHCVMQSLRGFIPPAEWSRMFEEIWDFWRDEDGAQLNWDGGRRGQPGTIRNARECCKYVTKPGDMVKLSGEDLRKTFEALEGLKLVQPLGSLRKEIARRRTEKKRLVRQPTPEGSVWREVFDWNKHAETTEEEREFAENVRESQTFAAETAIAARTKPGITPASVGERPPWCQVLSRLAPAVGPRMVKEPRAIVGGNVFDAATVRRHPLVTKLWEEAVQGWEEGLAAEEAATEAALAGIRVHTVTPTAKRPPPWQAEPDPTESWETAFSA